MLGVLPFLVLVVNSGRFQILLTLTLAARSYALLFILKVRNAATWEQGCQHAVTALYIRPSLVIFIDYEIQNREESGAWCMYRNYSNST